MAQNSVTMGLVVLSTRMQSSNTCATLLVRETKLHRDIFRTCRHLCRYRRWSSLIEYLYLLLCFKFKRLSNPKIFLFCIEQKKSKTMDEANHKPEESNKIPEIYQNQKGLTPRNHNICVKELMMTRYIFSHKMLALISVFLIFT